MCLEYLLFWNILHILVHMSMWLAVYIKAFKVFPLRHLNFKTVLFLFVTIFFSFLIFCQLFACSKQQIYYIKFCMQIERKYSSWFYISWCYTSTQYPRIKNKNRDLIMEEWVRLYLNFTIFLNLVLYFLRYRVWICWMLVGFIYLRK